MNLRRVLSCLLLYPFLIFLVISSVGARTHELIIQPKKEVTVDTPTLTPPDSVAGNMTVQGGFVDFYVSSPKGKVVFCHNQTPNTDFNFTASESGNYTFHFVNSLLAENITVVLNYRIEFVVESKVNINVDYSVGTVIVHAPPPLPPRPRRPNPENICEKYFNFLRAGKILTMVRGIWMYMPLGPLEIIGILAIILLPVPLFYWISSRHLFLNMG